MKNFLQNTIAILILCAVVFWFRVPLKHSYLSGRDKFFPCQFPIRYSIGDFDNRFGISQDEFLLYIKTAENIWENAVRKNLFSYIVDGDLKINLVYDDRQETTNKLSNMGSSIDNQKDSLENMKKEYEILKNDYLESKNKIKTASDIEILNQKIDRLNSLAKEIERFGNNINTQINEYNTTGDSLGEEFDEGIYQSDKNGKKIDIYEYKNKDMLVRLLVHEMGHALSLGHSINSEAIMYKINLGNDTDLSEDDIKMLKDHCGIK